MSRTASLRSIAFLLPLGACLLASNASAHIEMTDPPSRYGRESNKVCPCGLTDGGPTCNLVNGEASDDNRDENNVTQYEVGSTITIQFEEYIGHSGRFRVAFDGDGADLTDFNATILADVADPDDAAGLRQIEVTLPTPPVTTARFNCSRQ